MRGGISTHRQFNLVMKYLNFIWSIIKECITHPLEDGYLIIGRDGKVQDRMNNWKINRTGEPGLSRKQIVP
jgi:hypothetical protein